MRKAIAIDFDGCLCTDAYPEIGEPNWTVIYRAKAEQRAGAGLILWTCREGQLLLNAIAACEGWGLTFDAVNESLPDWIEAFGTKPRKVGATEYWDDKAASIPVTDRFFVGGPGDDSIELIEPKPNTELKPCPFCRSTHVIYERYGAPAGERWRCWCAECLAGIDPGTAQEAGQVREMWNRRVESNENRINQLCMDILSISDAEFGKAEEIVRRQREYIHPFRMATVKRLNELGEFNTKVIAAMRDLRELIKSGESI